MNDENVVSLADRLKAKRKEAKDFDALLSAKGEAHGVLAPAVERMRELGFSSGDIAKTLRFVADVLGGKEV
jgi:hypothetical protein